MLDAAWIIAMAACAGWGVPCFCPPSSQFFLILTFGFYSFRCKFRSSVVTYVVDITCLPSFGISAFMQLQFHSVSPCALSLLSLALLTRLPCDNSCWKTYRRAEATRVSWWLLNAAFTAIPYPSGEEQESPCCCPALSLCCYPALLCSWQADGCPPWGTQLVLLRIPQSRSAKQTSAIH